MSFQNENKYFFNSELEFFDESIIEDSMFYY